MATESGESHDRFSLVAGGPFHALLRQLRWVGKDLLPTRRAALNLALLAWFTPAALAVVQSLLDDSYVGWSFFTDLTAYARFLIAITAMIITERHADGRLEMLARQFRSASIIADAGLPAFRTALARADRHSSSNLAEGALAVAALAWSGLTERYVVELANSSWEGTMTNAGVEMSWAGLAARFVSNPLFLFLVFRWVWRFLIWALLLYRISKLPLQLTPLHPDQSAGLGFLAIYPSIFSGFLFALSCVVASSFLKDLSLVEHGSRTIWFAVGGWIAIGLGLFLGPLSVFARPIYLAREQALINYGRLANQHHLAFERKWMGEVRSGEELLGNPDVSSLADLNAGFVAVHSMHLIPVDREAVVGLFVAAGLPMLAVLAKEIPITDLLKWIAGAIF